MIRLLFILFSISMFSQNIKVKKKYYDEIKIEKFDTTVLNNLEKEKHRIKNDSLKHEKQIEKLHDSILEKHSMKEIRERYMLFNYKNNRSKILYEKIAIGENKRENQNKKLEPISLPCNCEKTNDTIQISTGFIFKSGLNFVIKLSNDNKFKSYYVEKSENYIFKENNEDKESKWLGLESKYQELKFFNKPVIGEVLTGSLRFSTNEFYEENRKGYVNVVIDFKCFLYNVIEK